MKKYVMIALIAFGFLQGCAARHETSGDISEFIEFDTKNLKCDCQGKFFVFSSKAVHLRLRLSFKILRL